MALIKRHNARYERLRAEILAENEEIRLAKLEAGSWLRFLQTEEGKELLFQDALRKLRRKK